MIASFISKCISFLWFFKATDGRYLHLQYCAQGFAKTGIAWVEYRTALVPFEAADDLGIYWVVAHLYAWFGLSVDAAIKLTIFGSLLGAWLIGLYFLFLIYPLFVQRLVGFLGYAALLLLGLHIGDVYVFYLVPPLALIPLGYYFYLSPKLSSSFYYRAAFCIGVLLGVTHFMRSFSGLSASIIIFMLLAGASSIPKATKLKMVLLAVFPVFLIFLSVAYHEQQHDLFVSHHLCDVAQIEKKHPIWHTIYLGFGYLKFLNKNNIVWDDACAKKRVDELKIVHPNTSDEELLKNEVFRMMHEEYFFVILTIFAKLGVLLLFFMLSAHIGIVVTFFYPLSFLMYAAFISALGAAAAAPLLAVPVITYSLNFIALSVLFGIVSINHAIRHIISYLKSSRIVAYQKL